ncbi:accessory gene regulator B family protein [Paenibacillus sp. FSL K6-2859]|uniref:accessory gene regulator B family protein n=1 Tax=Paenibacillus sp. FSL K6-2859 TaxID=2921482 RepID=UPI0030FCA7A9
MIELLAQKIVKWTIKYTDENQYSESHMMFFMLHLLTNTGVIVVSIFLGIASGELSGMFTAIISLAVLRRFSGGFHLKSPEGCILVTVIAAYGATIFSVGVLLEWLFHLVTLGIIFLFAPNPSNDLVKGIESHKVRYKLISVLLVVGSMLWGNSVIINIFMFQAITIIPFTSNKKGGEKI